MKMKIALLFAAVVFYSSGIRLHAENGEESPLTFRHGVGFAAGFVTGYGLSYRRYLEKLALQFTLAPYVQAEEATISSGIAAMKSIYRGKGSGLFVYSGIHYLYSKSKKFYAGDNSEKMKEEEGIVREVLVREQNLNIGFGPGFEIKFTENVVFNIMGGYALYLTDRGGPSINFTGETALFYCF